MVGCPENPSFPLGRVKGWIFSRQKSPRRKCWIPEGTRQPRPRRPKARSPIRGHQVDLSTRSSLRGGLPGEPERRGCPGRTARTSVARRPPLTLAQGRPPPPLLSQPHPLRAPLTALPALMTMTPWAKRRKDQPQAPRSRLPGAQRTPGPPWRPAGTQPGAPCATEAPWTTAPNRPCPLRGRPTLKMGRKIPGLQPHPRDCLHPTGGHLGCCPPNHSPDPRSPGAGRMVTMPQPPSPPRCYGLPSPPRSPLVSPQGHKPLKAQMTRTAAVTMMLKRKGSRLKPRPRHFGPGRLSLDISVRSGTGPLLSPADIHTGLAVAEDPGYGPPAPRRPPWPPGFTRGWILTQLLTTGEAWAAMKTAKRQGTNSHSRPPTRAWRAALPKRSCLLRLARSTTAGPACPEGWVPGPPLRKSSLHRPSPRPSSSPAARRARKRGVPTPRRRKAPPSQTLTRPEAGSPPSRRAPRGGSPRLPRIRARIPTTAQKRRPGPSGRPHTRRLPRSPPRPFPSTARWRLRQEAPATVTSADP